MPDLISLSDYRTLSNIDPTDTRNDAQLTALIPMASSAVLAFAERDFGAPQVIEDRTFDYDGSGFLDIDDASSVTAVKFTYPYGTPITLDSYSWRAMPGPVVFYYVVLPGYTGSIVGSPEMGFRNNLDVYARERRSWSLPDQVTVSAIWGWPIVPDDVKMAVVWTLQEWMARPSGEGITAEAIEGWSRSWGTRSGASAAALAIPERARDLLAAYAKVDV